ncbi:MAG: DNA repair protein RecO [Chloroflexi bacterium]|nr:DNA repair protein RecO [Chloroflexota bacterium]
MARPYTYRTEAIILRHWDMGEADRLIALFTPYLGKVRAVAKGARRPRSKLGGHLELFTHSQLAMARGRNLDLITQAQTIQPFSELRADLALMASACYLIELVDRATEDRQESFPLYDLTLRTLGRLGQARKPQLLLRWYELQMLEVLGYRPQLEQCVKCQQPLEPADNFFSATLGGVLCPDCGRGRPDRLALSVDGLKVLRNLQRSEWTLAERLRLSEPLGREVAAITQAHLRHVLESDIRSLHFLERIGGSSGANPVHL